MVTVHDYRRAADEAERYIREHRDDASYQLGYQRELDAKAAEAEFYAVAAISYHKDPHATYVSILANQVTPGRRTGLYDPDRYTVRYNELLDLFEEAADRGEHLQP